MNEDFKIPGLDWEGLTIQQVKMIQNLISQELQRYKSKEKYLARLQLLKLIPVPTEDKFNKHDPCDKVQMLKIEWNNFEMSQQNGHYMLTKNQNYAQNLRVVQKCIQMIPLEVHVEVMGRGPTPIETGKDLLTSEKKNKISEG